MTILSGLGQGTPKCLIFLPVISEDETIAVIELAFFKPIIKQEEDLLAAFSIELAKKMDSSAQKTQNN